MVTLSGLEPNRIHATPDREEMTFLVGKHHLRTLGVRAANGSNTEVPSEQDLHPRTLPEEIATTQGPELVRGSDDLLHLHGNRLVHN